MKAEFILYGGRYSFLIDRFGILCLSDGIYAYSICYFRYTDNGTMLYGVSNPIKII